VVTFHSADHAAREYLRLRGALTVPKTQRLTVSAGKAVAKSCPGCQGLESFLGKDKLTREDVLRCRRCRRPWPVEDVEVPRQRLGGGRGGELEDRLAELGTLTVLLERRVALWPRRVLLLYATGAFSVPRLAGECRRRWPRRQEPWSIYRVREDLGDARSSLERGLRCARMLSE